MDTHAKLQRYFYEESKNINVKFSKINKLIHQIFTDLAKYGKIYNDLLPYTKSIVELTGGKKKSSGNKIEFTNVKKTTLDRLKKGSHRTKAPRITKNLLMQLYVSGTLNKPFNKLVHISISKHELDLLTEDLDLVILPYSARSKNASHGAAYFPEFKMIVIYLPGLEATRSINQVSYLLSPDNAVGQMVQSQVYHEITHFVQEDDIPIRIKRKINELFIRTFGISIAKKYQNRLEEIEAYVVNSIVFYAFLNGADSFIEKSQNNDFAQDVIKSDLVLDKIFESMNSRSKKKTITLINKLGKKLRGDRKLLESIVEGYTSGNISNKFSDRLISALQNIKSV